MTLNDCLIWLFQYQLCVKAELPMCCSTTQWVRSTLLNHLIATLRPQSNGPSSSNTMTGNVHWPLMGGMLHLVQRAGD